MVAVKAHQANSFLKKPDPHLHAFLFYGTDAGLVSERARQLAKTLANAEDPSGEIIRLDDFDLESAPDRLAVELGTMPMFGGCKIIHATTGRRINATTLKAIVEQDPLPGKLVVEAGNLKPTDAARKAFEKAQHAAAIACFPDNQRDIGALISEVLSDHQLTIEPQLRDVLIARLGGDRALSRGELEKLALYAAGKNKIEISDIDAVMGDATEMTLDRIAAASASGSAAEALVQLSRAFASGERGPGIVSAVLRYYHRLHRVRVEVDSGQPIDAALRKLRPPLHFKQRDVFSAQLGRWNRNRLDRALLAINEASAQTRINAGLEHALTERLLLRLSSLAQTR